MILSVLIPTYNCDCTKLVRDLARQIPEGSEIIVGDDGSTDSVIQKKLEMLDQIPHCHLWRAQHNLGRSAIRNRLAHEALGEWIIFMDSDAEVPDEEYIKRYLGHRDADVVVGGTQAPRECPGAEVSLRYRYERTFWMKATPQARSRQPYECFTSFNFMIRREAFLGVQFDESCRKYGHEDTLLGLQLEQHGMQILHIDNPLIHNGLEVNSEYLSKTEESLKSLYELRERLSQTSALLRVYGRLESCHATPVLRIWHRLFGRVERSNLCSTHPSLLLFKLYKLGYYASI